MRILVLNSGSSSLKFKLFKMSTNECLCSGMIDKISEESSHIDINIQEKTVKKNLHVENHAQALEIIFDILKEKAILISLDELKAVGHRVVHGGEFYSDATFIDEEVIQNLEDLIPLAPLHNPANISGIKAVRSKSKELKQVAVFDTAFHQSMPSFAYTYALPIELYKEDKIRRYGFHGTSHNYILKASAKLLNKDVKDTNIISLHLGNGASICAIKNGKSVDTSMGFTPLEGLVMGTRSGDIDPAIIFYLHNEKNYSLKEIDKILNKKSGLLGLSGENDMREILQNLHVEKYRLAFDVFVYRIKKYIGSYLAIMLDIDAIVFTGGIGEHSAKVREEVCKNLELLNLHVDLEKNLKKESLEIQKDNAKIKIFVISTNEELEIALQTKELLT